MVQEGDTLARPLRTTRQTGIVRRQVRFFGSSTTIEVTACLELRKEYCGDVARARQRMPPTRMLREHGCNTPTAVALPPAVFQCGRHLEHFSM